MVYSINICALLNFLLFRQDKYTELNAKQKTRYSKQSMLLTIIWSNLRYNYLIGNDVQYCTPSIKPNDWNICNHQCKMRVNSRWHIPVRPPPRKATPSKSTRQSPRSLRTSHATHAEIRSATSDWTPAACQYTAPATFAGKVNTNSLSKCNESGVTNNIEGIGCHMRSQNKFP